MKFKIALVCFLCGIIYSQTDFCNVLDSPNRSIYEIGDTLSVEDQNKLFPVCNGNGDYIEGDSFKFSDYNGNINGGDYKITVISMNATW
tara:strand:- start:383 stop:649 length:267 start_codon:yes stop_codon:yes gene_type:complete